MSTKTNVTVNADYLKNVANHLMSTEQFGRDGRIAAKILTEEVLTHCGVSFDFTYGDDNFLGGKFS